jgi:ATP-dependent DNA helicase RecG
LLDQKGKGSATYYTLNQNFTNKDLPNKLEKLASPNPTSSTDKDLSSELTRLDSSNLASSSTDKDLSSELARVDPSNLADNLTLLGQMPQVLRQVVENLGQRANTEELSNAIVKLCQWRDLSSSELAIILNRNQVYLRNNYLNRLIKLGKLEYVRSGSPSDPHQAYRAIAKSDAI